MVLLWQLEKDNTPVGVLGWAWEALGKGPNCSRVTQPHQHDFIHFLSPGSLSSGTSSGCLCSCRSARENGLSYLWTAPSDLQVDICTQVHIALPYLAQRTFTLFL